MKTLFSLCSLLVFSCAFAADQNAQCSLNKPSDLEAYDATWISLCENGKAEGYLVLKLYDKNHVAVGDYFGEAKNGIIKTGVATLKSGFRASRYSDDGKPDRSDDHLAYMNSFDVASFSARSFAKYHDAQGRPEAALHYRKKADAFEGFPPNG